jgi:hypothetical protein
MANFIFESETCGRCGGSGHYSYCQMYGTTCFKCCGKKETLTKRGAAAQAYFTQLCSKRADEIVAGDKILDRGFAAGSYVQPSAWCTVAVVRPGEVGRDGGSVQPDGSVVPAALVIETNKGTFHGSTDTMYRVAQGKDEKASKVQQALAYQASLTPGGDLRKAPPGGCKVIKLKAETTLINAANPNDAITLPAGAEVKYKSEVINGTTWHTVYHRTGGDLYTASRAQAEVAARA